MENLAGRMYGLREVLLNMNTNISEWGGKIKVAKDTKKYKIGIYLRFGNRVYTSFEEIRQERNKQMVISRMTPEQIEFCEKIKIELENRKYTLVR